MLLAVGPVGEHVSFAFSYGLSGLRATGYSVEFVDAGSRRQVEAAPVTPEAFGRGPDVRAGCGWRITMTNEIEAQHSEF